MSSSETRALDELLSHCNDEEIILNEDKEEEKVLSPTPSFSPNISGEEDDEVIIKPQAKNKNKRSIDNLLRIDPLPNEKLEEIRATVTSELKQENIRLRKQVALLSDEVREIKRKLNSVQDDLEKDANLGEQVEELYKIAEGDKLHLQDMIYPLQERVQKIEGMNNRMYFWFKDMERKKIYVPPNPSNGSMPSYSTPPSPGSNSMGRGGQNSDHWGGRGPKVGGRF